MPSIDPLLEAGDSDRARTVVLNALKEGEPWPAVLKMADRFVIHGMYDSASVLLDALEKREKASGFDRLWIRYARIQLGIRQEGVGPHQGPLETLLTADLPAAVKATLRRALILHLDEIADRDRLSSNLLALLSENPSLPSIQLAERLGAKHSLAGIAAALSSTAELPLSEISPVEALPAHELDCSQGSGLPPPPPLHGSVLSCPPTAIYIIENAVVLTLNELVFVLDGQDCLVPRCSNPPLLQFEERIREGLDAAHKSEPLPGTTALIRDRFLAHNYCHWLLDVLPRLAVCEKSGETIDRIACFGVSTEFERESLDLTGHGGTDVVPCETAAQLRFERLVVPDNTTQSHRHPMQFMHPELLRWWDGHLEPLHEQGRPTHRLYIPRRKNRCVTNGSELADELRSRGFEEVEPGELSLRDQIRLFSQAEAVVGSHGAALTNLLFARPGCRVLEFFPHVGGTAAYQILSAGRRHDYSFYKSPPLGSDTWFNDFPITIDMSVVKKWLDARGFV